MFPSSKRLLLLIATGCVLLQTPACSNTLQVVSTGLLAALTGIAYYIARKA